MGLATALVVVALLLAAWLTTRFLPPAWQQIVTTPLGYIAPVSYLVTAACMALGGAIAGRRFLIVALGLTLAVWIATILLLAGIALPTDEGSRHLAAVVRTNAFSAVLSLAAAAIGAHSGTRWHERRARRSPA